MKRSTPDTNRSPAVRRPLAMILAACGLSAFPYPASADTWIGSGDGVSWDDPFNWSPTGVPNSSATVVTFNAGSPASTIDLGGIRLANRVEGTSLTGDITLENTSPGGYLGLFATAPGSGLFTTGGIARTLTVNTDVQLFDSMFFNTDPTGSRIVVNGDVTLGNSVVTAKTLTLTSRNVTTDNVVQVNGVISDGANAVLSLDTGYVADGANHRGAVTMTGLNTYTGATRILTNILRVNSIADAGVASALGAASGANATITIGSGFNATLAYVGTDPAGHSSNRNFALAGALNNTSTIEASGAGPLVLSGNVTPGSNAQFIAFDGINTGENTFAGVLNPVAGAFVLSLIKNGVGTWVFTGANVNDGSTTINGGNLILRGAGARIGGGAAISSMAINSGGTFTLDGGTVSATELDRNAGGIFNFLAGTVNLSSGTSTFNAAQGALTVGTSGNGVLNLSGTTAQFNAGLTIQGAGDAVNLTSGSLTTTSLLNNNGGTLTFTGGTLTINTGQITTGAGLLAGTIAGTGGLTKIGAGTLTITGLMNYTGGTNVQVGTLIVDNQAAGGNSVADNSPVVVSAGALLINKADDLFGSLAGAGNVQLDAPTAFGGDNASTTFSGMISGVSNLLKGGTGTWTLTGTNNTYGGTTTVNDAGTLRLAAGNTLPDLTRVSLTVSGAALDLNNFDETIGSLTGVAGSVVNLGTATLTVGGNNETQTFSGNMTGSGGLMKIGNGTQVLSGVQTFTGNITISDGTLEIGVSNTIGANAVFVDTTATLRVVGDGESFGSLSGSGTVVAVANVAAAVNPGFDNLDSTFSGTITGVGGFTKSGTGTMTMTGLSTLTGQTRVDNGVLIFDGAGAGVTATNQFLLNGGDAIIRNGATITTTGTADLFTTTSSLRIESGGSVSATNVVRIGENPGDVGAVTVTGLGSMLQSANRVRVGSQGKGTLDVLAGGTVSAASLVVSDVAIGASGSALTIDGFIGNGPNGIFGDADDLVSRVNVTGAVGVGSVAPGSLTIQNGGRLTSGTGSGNHSANAALLGTTAAADGSIVTITGAMSRWVNNGYITVATSAGNAVNPVELQVLAGGYGEFSYLATSAGDGSRSKITVDGAGSILHLRDARGDAGVTNPGFGDLRMTPSASNGYSEILVTGGGLLDLDTNASIGDGGVDTAGQAYFTVRDAGSVLDVGKELIVGYTGTSATLKIEDGGIIHSGTSDAIDPNGFTRDSFIARSTSTASAIIGAPAGLDTGHAEAAWIADANLYIAGTAAGNNTSGIGQLGIHPTGRVSVAGALRVWDRGTVQLLGGLLEVDSINLTDSSVPITSSPTFNFNSGTLRFTNAIGTTLDAALLGQLLGASPTLTVGKHIDIDHVATLTAPLRLNGGTFSAGSIDSASIAQLDFDAGTFNLTQDNLAVGAGGLFGPALVIGLGKTINVTNMVTIEPGAHLAVLGGFNSGGLTSAGTLLFADTTGLGKTISGTVATTAGSTVTLLGAISFADLVSGPGQFFGPGTANFLGGYNPGASPALVAFEGSVVNGPSSALQMELGGSARGTGYDALDVAGNLGFGGTLNVPLIAAFQPKFGDAFNLFDSGSRTGNFSAVNLPTLVTGLLWDQSNLYTTGEINVGLDLAIAGRTWDGGGADDAWSTATNWLTNAEPLNNGAASLIFAGTTRLTPSVDTPWNVAVITFDNTAGAFTITGPQGITVGAGGITNDDADLQTITAQVTLGTSESFTAAAGDLAFANVAIGANTLTIAGANDVELDDVTGTGTITKTGAGDLDLIGTIGTGGITLNANEGTTNIGADQTLAAFNIGASATVVLGAIAPADSLHAIPEPGVTILLASGLLGIFGRRRCASV